MSFTFLILQMRNPGFSDLYKSPEVMRLVTTGWVQTRFIWSPAPHLVHHTLSISIFLPKLHPRLKEVTGPCPRLIMASGLEGLGWGPPPEWFVNSVLSLTLSISCWTELGPGEMDSRLNGNGEAGDDMNNLNYGLNLHRA